MFQKVNAVFKLLPQVMAIVLIVEPLFDASVPGARKKAAALDAMRKVGTPEPLLNVASDLIDLVISVFNAVGVFTKADGTHGSVADDELSDGAKSAKVDTARALEEFELNR